MKPRRRGSTQSKNFRGIIRGNDLCTPAIGCRCFQPKLTDSSVLDAVGFRRSGGQVSSSLVSVGIGSPWTGMVSPELRTAVADS
ncbi:hypothetical protein Droror1_Dr00000351, partial [Drosera rotundifolia]